MKNFFLIPRIYLRHVLFLFTLFTIVSVNLFAQKTVTGTITGEDNKPVSSVNIKEKGTSGGVISDANGKYKIDLKNSKSILIFSAVGYSTQEIAVENKTVIDVSVVIKEQTLDEATVIGYGSQRKKLLTGAVSSVTAKDISNLPLTGLDQALQGRIAGVQVTQNTGEPGGNISVRIRGVGSISAGS